MASNHDHGNGEGGRGSAGARRAPEWADGLKQLYDSVVEEDLPDTFKNLLDRLDQLSGGGESPGSNDNGNDTGQGTGSASPDGRGPRK